MFQMYIDILCKSKFRDVLLPQMRKMMSSATMIWLSSCMRARAERTSGSLKGL